MNQRVSPTTERLKVLFPIYGLKGGGAERIVITLVNHLDRTLFMPVLVLLDMDGSYLTQVHPDVKVIRLYEEVRGEKVVEKQTPLEAYVPPTAEVDLRERIRGTVRERLPPDWVDEYRRIKNHPTLQDGLQDFSRKVRKIRSIPHRMKSHPRGQELHDAFVLAGQGIRSVVRGIPTLYSMPRHLTRKIVTRHWETFGILKEVNKSLENLQPHFEKFLDREKPDAIVAHLLLGNSVALQAGPERGIFTAVCMHNTLKDYQTREEYRHSPLEQADAIVTVSHTIGDIFRNKFGEKRVRVIHNPHDLDRIDVLSREPVLHPWFVQKDLPLVMGIGRLSRQKNFPLLVEAVCALNQEGTCPVRLVLFGEGPDRDRLMRMVQKNGQQERIRLLGWTANPFRYLARADLFVLCSNWEGLPNTLIEAMACDVPVISTDCDSGPREILQDGACGRLVAQKDVKAMQDAILEILKDPQKAEAFRKRGRQRALEFHISRKVPCYEKLILEGVGRKRRGSYTAL